MKNHSIFILLLVTFLPAIIAERSYNGYKVYTVSRTDNETQYEALVRLQQKSSRIDFWSDPSRNRPMDIMVPPEEAFLTESFLRSYGIDYSVAIPDVQRAVEKEKSVRTNRQDSEMNWKEYQRLGTIHGWLEALASHSPALAQIDSIGRSTEGRDLKMLKLVANPANNNPVIYIDGGIHAREWISPAVVTYLIGKLMTVGAEDRALIENVDWYFVPVLNPDGYEFTHTEDRLWRKSRSKRGGTGDDCVGVDLNRNFDFHWGEVGVKEDPCANTYPGPFAFSEPEANATANFLFANRNRIRSYLTFHSYSQLWLTPYGYTEELTDDYDELEDLGQRAVRALEKVHGTEYEVGAPSRILYLYGGSSQDWAREFGNVKFSYTIELRDDGESKFLLPSEEILPTGEETWEALKVVARQVIRREKIKRNGNSKV